MKRIALLVFWLSIFSWEVWPVYGLNLQNFHNLVVFGDSLSDNGNSLAAIGLPKSPYYSGRWTNGPNWVDYFSYFSAVNHHYLPATGFLENRGTNFAVGGLNSSMLAGEIGAYLASSGGRASANNLYVIWIGANDFKQNVKAKATVSDIEGGIVSLWAAGARNFILINLPDISLTPEVKAYGTATDLAAKQYIYTVNAALQAQIPYYASLLRITVLLLDTNGPLTQLVNNLTLTVPGLGKVSFANSSGAAFSPKTGVVPNPNSYVFWDGFHPTTLVHLVAGWIIFNDAFPGAISGPVAR